MSLEPIFFFHPDLGKGGAERLIVDAAFVNIREGRRVRILTGRYTRESAFGDLVAEVERPGSLLSVHPVAAWLPQRLPVIRAELACASLRAAWAVLIALLAVATGRWEVPRGGVVADQVAHWIGWAVWWWNVPWLFYCHFPDALLVQQERSGTVRASVKAAYRLVADAVERRTTAGATLICVNSRFTQDTFNTFMGDTPPPSRVLYPAVSRDLLNRWQGAPAVRPTSPRLAPLWAPDTGPVLLSVNRFERKKNVGILLDAAALFASLEFNTPVLVVLAGGFDPTVPDNARYMDELQQQIRALPTNISVLLVPSFSEEERTELLARARIFVYTPMNEHFGIGPLEAMLAQLPVVAMGSGGPRETVVPGVTGMLVEPTPDALAGTLVDLLESEGTCRTFGAAGAQRVAEYFSPDAFSRNWLAALEKARLLHTRSSGWLE